MNDLSGALRGLVALFEELQIAYAVMGGLAVRVYAIRPGCVEFPEVKKDGFAQLLGIG
jgi:hypothetical protein